MNGYKLSKFNHEKDLGITISNDLKPSKRCSDVVKKAKSLPSLELIFSTNLKKLSLHYLMHLYALIQNIVFSFGYRIIKNYIDKLERIQRKVTKIIPRLQNKSYEELLKELNLFSLSKRRLRGGLIEVFKIFRAFDNINRNNYVTIDLTSTTRNTDHW